MPESAARIQEMAPTCAAADQLYEERVADRQGRRQRLVVKCNRPDRGLQPRPRSSRKIKAKVRLINTVETRANLPELGTRAG
jgi:hypothetical protein